MIEETNFFGVYMQSFERKTSRNNTLLGLSIVVIIIVTVIAVYFFGSQSRSGDKVRQITYKVESAGGYALIVYTSSPSHQTESRMLTTPFSKTISLPIGTEVYLTASNPSQTGTISCKIQLNSRDWIQNKSKHPTDSVACGGIIR